jgi:hypothetical protein
MQLPSSRSINSPPPSACFDYTLGLFLLAGISNTVVPTAVRVPAPKPALEPGTYRRVHAAAQDHGGGGDTLALPVPLLSIRNSLYGADGVMIRRRGYIAE